MYTTPGLFSLELVIRRYLKVCESAQMVEIILRLEVLYLWVNCRKRYIVTLRGDGDHQVDYPALQQPLFEDFSSGFDKEDY